MSDEKLRRDFEDFIAKIEFPPGPVFLDEPLTSTSWDGDSKTSADDGILDLSSVFGAPAGIKAAMCKLSVASSTPDDRVRLGPSSSQPSQLICRAQVSGVANDNSDVVTCDSNGDVYVTINGTVNVVMEIWGYWI